MDRRVKERLVGATILVMLVVLIVPELLSGPKRNVIAPARAAGPAESMRNVTVDLATSKATAAEDALASAGPEPAAASTPPPAAASAEPPGAAAHAADEPALRMPPAPAPPPASSPPPTVATLKAQQPGAAPLENPPPPPTSRDAGQGEAPHPGWAVQVGSFASRAHADRLMRHLQIESWPARVSATGTGTSLRYRVRVGPLADRGAAERTQLQLRHKGYSVSLVPP